MSDRKKRKKSQGCAVVVLELARYATMAFLGLIIGVIIIICIMMPPPVIDETIVALIGVLVELATFGGFSAAKSKMLSSGKKRRVVEGN